MRIEVLSIGDELLDGRVTDTNCVRLAQALSDVGAHLSQRTTITDDIDAIVREARAAAARGTGLCVVSGGLGPTTDDLTAEAFARLQGVPLVRDPEQAIRITALLQARGRAISENQLRQAERPQGAEVIANPVGSAPGFAVVHAGCRFVSLPGVPREFDVLVENAVVGPMRAGSVAVLRRALYTFGLGEGDVDRRLQPIHTHWPAVRLQYRVKMPETHITMHAPQAAMADLDAAFNFARSQLGDYVFASHGDGEGFARRVVEIAVAQNATVSLAESCTGGLAADLLTDVPGSSRVLQLGIVAYSNAAKMQLLNVEEATLLRDGAVSEAVVLQMAKGVRERGNTTYGLAASGIAGPGGGTSEKPVGTVWLALDGPYGSRAHKLSLPFERRNNKLVSAYSLLDMLRRAF